MSHRKRARGSVKSNRTGVNGIANALMIEIMAIVGFLALLSAIRGNQAHEAQSQRAIAANVHLAMESRN